MISSKVADRLVFFISPIVMFLLLAGCIKLTIDLERGYIGIPSSTSYELSRIPGYERALQSQENFDYYRPNDVSMAMDAFYIEWCVMFGDYGSLVQDNLDHIFIEWTEHKRQFKSAFSIDGTKVRDGNAIGIAYGKEHIWVHTRQGDKKELKIYNTSLIHELVHASLGAIYGSLDADHEGDKYRGWTAEHSLLIQRVNETLKMLDI